MWIAILIFIFSILIMFLWARHRMEQKIVKKGGLELKYSKLIEQLIKFNHEEGVSNLEIKKKSNSWLNIFIDRVGTIALFQIIMTFQTLTIVFKIKFISTGKIEKIEWNFPKEEDQEYMANKINNDIFLFFKKHYQYLNNYFNT